MNIVGFDKIEQIQQKFAPKTKMDNWSPKQPICHYIQH